MGKQRLKPLYKYAAQSQNRNAVLCSTTQHRDAVVRSATQFLNRDAARHVATNTPRRPAHRRRGPE